MDKKLVRAFIQECIDVQDWEARQKANYIEMNDWFRYSGQVEEEKELYEFESYEPPKYIDKLNHMCTIVHDIRKEIKEYENTNKNGNKQRK